LKARERERDKSPKQGQKNKTRGWSMKKKKETRGESRKETLCTLMWKRIVHKNPDLVASNV
jgi:hypothetical protein